MYFLYFEKEKIYLEYRFDIVTSSIGLNLAGMCPVRIIPVHVNLTGSMTQVRMALVESLMIQQGSSTRLHMVRLCD